MKEQKTKKIYNEDKERIEKKKIKTCAQQFALK